MNDFSHSLPMLLYRALDAVMPPFREIFQEFGITEQQWRVLRCLWDADGSSLVAVANETLISGPSLVGVIDRLERDGLVVRRRSEIDRRVVNIHLTGAGKKLRRAVQPRVDAVYSSLKSNIGTSRWRAAQEALDDVIQAQAAYRETELEND